MKGHWQVAGIVVLAATVGGAVGALVAAGIFLKTTSTGTSLVGEGRNSEVASASQYAPTVRDHLTEINTLFAAEWPHVDNSEEWRIYLYNAQTPLEGEWSGLSERIHIDGVDMVRARVENWRMKYAAWIDETAELLREHPPSDSHESVKAAHARGLRILNHVEALLAR